MTLVCHNGITYTIVVIMRSQVGGREKQKRRTRTALLTAAAGLARQGKAPTVAAVAEAADISRRTAYRYFPSQEQLLVEIGLEQTRPAIEAAIARAAAQTDPEVSLDIVVQAVQRAAFQNRGLLYAMVRLSLERRLGGQAAEGEPMPAPVRGGRRLDWIRAAIAPLRQKLGQRKFERLVSALTLCVGIEAVIALRDIRALDQEESISVCRWTARSLLRASLSNRQS
jgi:AcrR family transcriptional regulator